MSKALKKLLGVGLLVLIAMGVMVPVFAAQSPSLDVPLGDTGFVADSNDTSTTGLDPLPPTPEPPPPPPQV